MSDLRAKFHEMYERDGKLTPETIVAEAVSDPLLHAELCWDDAVAGHQHRLEQARKLIRSVRWRYADPTENEPPKTVRAFVSVKTEIGHHYVPTEKVRDDPFLRQLALQEMEREWRALFKKFQEHEEFLNMVRGDIGGLA